MVRTEPDKLVIEILTSVPDTLYWNLLHDIPALIYALQHIDQDFQDNNLPPAIATLLVFYKSILPTESEVGEMLKKRKKK